MSLTPVVLSRISRIFGDRILLRKLSRPEKRGGLFVPASYAKHEPRENEAWWGVIEKFGLDSRYGEAYGLKVGDVVGVNSLGVSNEGFLGDDGERHQWVMEEFLLCKDEGRVKAFREDAEWKSKRAGLTPLGPYLLVRPDAEETKRGGIILSTPNESRTGQVLATSKGYLNGGELTDLFLTPGAHVLFGKYSSVKADMDEVLLFIKNGGPTDQDVIAELTAVEEKAEKKEAVHAGAR